jgi:hemoglobin/transferrin/lactoferrin receptor protein
VRYNFQRGTEEMDNGELSRSRHAAPAFGIARLTYQINKLNMQFYSVFNAEVSYAHLNPEERSKKAIYAKDGNGNPYSPQWKTLNFKTMYRLGQKFMMSAGIENLFNLRYRPYSSGLVAPGRNFILSAHINF